MYVERGGVMWDGDYALVAVDPETQTFVWVKDLGDSWEIRTDQHGVEESLDANAEFEKASHGRKMGDWVRIASVPAIAAEKAELDQALADGDDAYLSRFFNDPDHAKFRTNRGRF